MIPVLRSLLFTIIFYAGSVITVTGALLAGFVSRRGLYLGPKLWAGWFLWCSTYLTGVRLKLEGEIPEGQWLFALKHEAAYETILTLWLFERPAVVMKAELRRLPVWGAAAARHGAIFVDRTGSAAMLRQMMRSARAAADAGRPVVIFPEGTRVAVGASPPLAAGFAGLYKILKLPVVPIALDSGDAWPKSLLKRPGTVTMRVGAPIPPGLPRAEIEARVHAAINALQRA